MIGHGSGKKFAKFFIPHVNKKKKTVVNMQTTKRRREDQCRRLDLDGRNENFRRNLTLIRNVRDACGVAAFVTVHQGFFVPPEVASATNYILYLTDWCPLDRIRFLLGLNEDLHVFAFLVTVDLARDDAGIDADWSRLHATHVVMRGFPSTLALYARWNKTLKGASLNVYQELAPDFNPFFVKELAVDQFVIPDRETHLRGELGRLGPLSMARHLDSLLQGKDKWCFQAIAHLENNVGREGHKLRKLSKLGQHSNTGTEEKDQEQDNVSPIPYAASGMRGRLDTALSGPIQDPHSVEQPYHSYKGQLEFANAWLTFLIQEHPQFCTLVDDMFLYNAGSAAAVPKLMGETFEDASDQRDGEYHIKKGAFGMNKDLLQALSDCKQKFMVGLMRIIPNRGVVHHANGIIINTDAKTVARYEPHGWHALGWYDHGALDELFRQKVTELGPTWAYVPPREFCAMTGTQSRAEVASYKDFPDQIRDPNGPPMTDRGFCMLISLMFVHYVLSYPDLSLKEVESLMAAKSDAQLAMEIRSYANTVVLNLHPDTKSLALVDLEPDPTDVVMPHGHFATTIHRDHGESYSVWVDMLDTYPYTPFKGVGSSLSLPRTVIDANVLIEERNSTLFITKLQNKMQESRPRSQLCPQDSDILNGVECILLNDLLQMFPNVKRMRLAIENGFPWYTEELMESVKTMETPQIIASIVQDLGPRVLGYFASDQGINVKLLNRVVEFRTVDEALNKFDWPLLYVTIKGVRHRASYYAKELGFADDRDGTTTHVVNTTRENIERQCKHV